MTSPLPCAICEATDTSPILKKFGHAIARCTTCGLVYASPRAPAESILARYSPAYFWNEYLPAHGVKNGVVHLDNFDRRYGPMLKLIGVSTRPPGHLFEIGTGAGFFLKAAQRAGWQVQGIEISREAAAFASKQLGLEVALAPAEQFDFPSNRFDLIVMFEVIEHLSQPRLVLEKVSRALRPNGTLVISTPNFNALSHLALGHHWAVLSPGEHLYYFTEASLSRLLSVSGFKSVHFQREFLGWGVFETMNPGCSHDRGSLRTLLYHALVIAFGPWFYRWILAKGWGDTLLCIAQR